MLNKVICFAITTSALFLLSACASAKPLEYEKRIIAAVSDTMNMTGNKEYDSIAASSTPAYINALTETENFRIIERQRLADVLKELNIGMTGLIDSSKSKQAGRLLGADAIIFINLLSADYSVNEQKAGSAVSTEEFMSVTIEARIVTIETGEILASVKETIKTSTKFQSLSPGITRGTHMNKTETVKQLMDKAASAVSIKLARQTPRIK